MSTIFEPGSVIYVAHIYCGVKQNLDNTELLVSWLNERFNCLFYAPWVAMARYSAKHVEWQMQRDFEWVRRSDGLFIFNATGSRGAERERQVAFDHLGHAKVLDFGALKGIDQIQPYHLSILEYHYGRRQG